MTSKKQPAHEIDRWDQPDPYLYHGTDNETIKVIQREGMNTGEGMEMSTLTEPTKRLWFGLNADTAHSFAHRRISSLIHKESWKLIKEKFGTDFGRKTENINPIEWEGPPGTPMPYEDFQSDEATDFSMHIWENKLMGSQTESWRRAHGREPVYSEIAFRHEVIVRIKEADMPKDCERDEYRLKGEGFIVQDQCDIPPELFEFCNIGKIGQESWELAKAKAQIDPKYGPHGNLIVESAGGPAHER
jgi:hypothetical protein